MKILMVNNRLKVYGGEGTYMTSVGDELIRQGHDVQYFGLKDPDNLHGNRYGIYAKKSKNPLKLIKNNYNRKQFAKILDEFKPDIIHLNLIYFTLTPSILVEAKKRNIKVVQTIHDGKMVCPSYQLFIHNENKPCTLCVNGDFKNCIKHKCHKNSRLLSYIACKEAEFNRKKGYYDLIDKFIFPSNFMRELHIEFGLPEDKTITLCNFSRIKKNKGVFGKKLNDKYVIFFGRLIKIKGIEVLIECIKMLPNVKFVIVGEGDMKTCLSEYKNCTLVGFKQGAELENLISNAICSVVPSICNENCPMSVLESIALGTPAIGSRIGGIPELIDEGNTGFTFECGNAFELSKIISAIYFDDILSQKLFDNCVQKQSVDNTTNHVEKIVSIYNQILVRN